jgi:hypothetical protein
MLATTIRLPTVAELKQLSLSDLAIASDLAYRFRERLHGLIQIDPYCLPDPFEEKDDYNYSIVLDRQNPNRIVAIIASQKDSLPQLPWSMSLGDRLAKVQASKEDTFALKNELMPKATDNFYPYRRGSRKAGMIMFAFEVCGLR